MTTRLFQGVALTALLVASGCGLPRSGPTKSEIFAGSVLRQGDAFIVTVTDRVNLIAGVVPETGFSPELRAAAPLNSDTIRPGDTLSLTIWENVEDGLLSKAGSGNTALPKMQVDNSGHIFVPYAGRVRAAGNTTEGLRRIITNKLKDQTPDPQVQVSRLAGEGANVYLLGAGGPQGIVPIERTTATLSQLMAKVGAGGNATDASAVNITLTRGSKSGTITLFDLLSDPRQDIALRDGDRIAVNNDQRSFISMGATGGQSQVKFRKSQISALEALAQVGGLNPSTADPTGVFIMRIEDENITEQITGVDVTGPQRVVYVLNLTVPNAMFMARDFAVRDKDTIYVTEAPLVTFNKTIAALTGTLNSVSSLSSAATSATNVTGLTSSSN